jgi:hypothetical protein
MLCSTGTSLFKLLRVFKVILLCYATALCERLTAAGADVTLKQYSETMLRSRAINGRYQLLLVSENTLDATALPDADILLLSAEEMEDPSCEN